ncbi:MAG TPA: hypothetical protein PLO57_03445 [Candidatus Cloacimonadota bacterium]|nr:hypothetical protein [Candidatus Cloacimonadota bacterium]
MEVVFKNMLKAYSGKCDGLVYYYNSRLGRVLCRKHVIPRQNTHNRRMAAISRNLKALNPSPEFRQDLKLYAALYQDAPLSGQNVYIKLMYALARVYGVDLATLTREQIGDQELPCATVKQAVDAGLLAPVQGYDRLTAAF